MAHGSTVAFPPRHIHRAVRCLRDERNAMQNLYTVLTNLRATSAVRATMPAAGRLR